MPEVLAPGFDYDPQQQVDLDNNFEDWTHPLLRSSYADLIEQTGIGNEYREAAKNWSPARGAIERAELFVDEDTSLEAALVRHFVAMMEFPVTFDQPDC